MKTSKYWIKHLGLKSHPEGGYFREVYRSPELLPSRALPNRFSESRFVATSIYFLLEKNQISALHYIQSDETWVFIDGHPLVLHQFAENYEKSLLGKDILQGQTPQHTIPFLTHFAAETTGDFTLVACFVAPGFDFRDFRFSDAQDLINKHPGKENIIEKFRFKGRS